MKKGAEPAFPTEVGFEDNQLQECFQSGNQRAIYSGMSTRLYLAGMAMQGILAGNYEWCSEGTYPVPKPIPSYVVQKALECADELLKQEEETR